METNTTYRFIKSVSTEMVIDTTKASGQGYVAHVWHCDDDAKLLGCASWNINNGVIYLWGFSSREEAVAALVEATAKKAGE